MPQDKVDKATLLEVLERTQWMIATTARELGVTRQAIYDALRRYKIRRRPVPKEALSEAKARGARAPKRAVA